MALQKFSKGEAIRFGWNTMKSNLGFFVTLLAIVLIVTGLVYYSSISIMSSIRRSVYFPNYYFVTILSYCFTIVQWFLYIIIEMCLIRVAIRFCDNEAGEFTDLFRCAPMFLKYVFGMILYRLICVLGTLLLIIPGIIWSIKFQFFGYFIVDKGCGPIEALKSSSMITRGAKWDLFLFNILLILINLAGVLCLLVGLFATIPTAVVALAFVYRKLQAHAEKTLLEEQVLEKQLF